MPPLDLLLIQPPAHLRPTDLGARQVSPNIGLAYIAAAQRRRGRTVAVLDAHALRWDPARIAAEAQRRRPRLIGLTAMTCEILSAAAVADRVKRGWSEAVVVLGGAHATAVPEQTLAEFPAFDATIVGEGEANLGLALDDAANGGLRARPGIYVRDGEPALSRRRPPALPPLDKLPRPAFDLFPLHAYWPFYSRRWLMELPLSASRGCPFGCTFCTKVMGNRPRFRTAGSLAEETHRNVIDYGMRQAIFTDENFTLNRELVHGYCEALMRRGLVGRIRLICQSRVTLSAETLALMARAGFTHITFGFEAGDQEILDRAAKGIRLDQSRAAAAAAKQAGMTVDGNFILGLPFETEQTIRRTIDFACSLPIDYASFFLLTPYPGSQVLAMARRGEGHLRLRSENWEDYGKQTGGAIELTTLPPGRLLRLQLLGYWRFYSRPKRWRPVLRKVTFATIAAFLRMRVGALLARDVRPNGAPPAFSC